MNIVVLCGGLSRERDVSITSGTKVYEALKSRGHNVVLTDLFFGYDRPYKHAGDIFSSSHSTVGGEIAEQIPDIEKLKKQNTDACAIGKNILEICRASDIVFMALHGEEGENGKLQALFDLYGVKYTGSGYLGSALAMNKHIAKQLFKQGGVKTPDGIVLSKQSEKYENIGFPCVVKPASCGSSVGTSIVQHESAYEDAVNLAFQFEDSIIVEKYIKGREFSVGVIDGMALPIIEICPKMGFYDYKNKYQSGMTDEFCPADLPEDKTQHMQQAALLVFELLMLEVYARIDFMMDEQGQAYCLEANTLPGMTPLSLLPQEAAAAGVTYEELCELIINKSLEKYR